ncbi:MAG: hypothetical protein ACI4J8_02045 [Oscillospiraceae bacterium]
MTKNNAQAKQTVRVFSAEGEEIGSTYPKRARGLVKKGRAQYVNDCGIRLIVSDVKSFTEETTMMDNIITANTDAAYNEPVNRLYFNAREWSFNKDCTHNVGNRSFMQGPDGVIREAFMLGDWGGNWTEIVSPNLTLQKNTLHTFTFWLNGGENDRCNEVCRFEVVFDGDYENRYTYNLNRSFIKPLKKCGGWELYEIPFRTDNNATTQLRFVAMYAYMTVMPAGDVSEYANLPDTTDPYEKYRPQRHNIVFADGWPNNTWYSTEKLEAAHGTEQSEAGFSLSKCGTQSPADGTNSLKQSIEGIREKLESIGSFDFSSIEEQIRSALEEETELDEEDIEEIISENVESAREALSEATENLSETLECLCDTLEDLLG